MRICQRCRKAYGRCTWTLKPCTAEARKIVEYVDALGREHHEHLCAGHIDDLQRGRTVANIRAQAKSMGLRTDVSLALAPESIALGAHQVICDACRGVREWIVEELAAGRMFGTEDALRAGRYTAERACAEGLALFQAAGAIYSQGGVAGLAERLRAEGRIA